MNAQASPVWLLALAVGLALVNISATSIVSVTAAIGGAVVLLMQRRRVEGRVPEAPQRIARRPDADKHVLQILRD